MVSSHSFMYTFPVNIFNAVVSLYLHVTCSLVVGFSQVVLRSASVLFAIHYFSECNSVIAKHQATVLKPPPNFAHRAAIMHPALTAISVPAHACNPTQPPPPLKIAPAIGFPTSKPTPAKPMDMPSLVPTVLISDESP